MEPVLWFGWFRADIIAEYADLFWRGAQMTVAMTWFRLPLFIWSHYATAIIMDTAVQLLQQAVDTREVIVFAFRQLPEMAPLLKDSRGLKIYEQADAIRKSASESR